MRQVYDLRDAQEVLRWLRDLGGDHTILHHANTYLSYQIDELRPAPAAHLLAAHSARMAARRAQAVSS